MKLILVIDDEESIRKSLSGILTDEGYDIISEGSGETGLNAFKEMSPNAVLLDIWLPNRDGISILGDMVKADKNIPVIMISGHSDIDDAIKTIKMGAYDFIEKPLSLDRILITVENAVKYNNVSKKKAIMAGSFSDDFEFIGESRSIRSLKEKILKAADADASVLIVGENGTGKEMVARALHLSGPKRDEPFIAINCAAIPEELIESEIFGYERGAFTGANSRKKGKFELADGGTLFLDEIGDMSQRMQSKILRVLQDNKFQRVGGESEVEVCVRVIAATNKDLAKEMVKGRFRSDLFYRLNVVPFVIPPLRERQDDIPLLINYFLNRFNNAHKLEIDKRAIIALQSYGWPGNVRELKNIIERFSIFNSQGKITEENVLEELKIKNYHKPDGGDNRNGYDTYNVDSFKEAKDIFEKTYLINKLKENGNNITKTAENIGMTRRNLQRKMSLLDIRILSGQLL